MKEYTLAAGNTISCATKHEVLRLLHALRNEGFEVNSRKKVITIIKTPEERSNE